VETKIDKYTTETINTYKLEEAKAYCEEKTQQGYVSKFYMQTE
jgi:hypothetical protein